MKPDTELSQNPAEDRAALREELIRCNDDDRLELFDALNRQADDEDEEVPEMPESLRDQLVEQFGDRAPKRAAAAAPAAPGFIETVVAFFKAKPLPAYGGLAAAACAIMFMMAQIGGVGDGPGTGKVDTIRGGDSRPAATADVPVYLFPEAKGGEVIEKMAEGREVVVCADAADFEKRLDAKWAVAVDLDRRVVLSFEDGEAVGETAVEDDGVRGVLLGIRAALDRMVK